MTPVPGEVEAQNAALDAVEPERLLDGEDEQTTYADDAIHWTKVYRELLDFKHEPPEPGGAARGHRWGTTPGRR